jgi:hypothetical protein
MSDVEIRSRLTSLLDVLEHESGALEDSGDPRPDETLRAIVRLPEPRRRDRVFRPPIGSGGHA